MTRSLVFSLLFFFNDTATTEIYTLSLHDALPISRVLGAYEWGLAEKTKKANAALAGIGGTRRWLSDRKSTRLNSSHQIISYAVFCLKKKKNSSTTARTHTTCHEMSSTGISRATAY